MLLLTTLTMPFVKGQSGNPAGRPEGATSPLSRTVKQTVLDVFNILQNDPQHSLEAFARKHPRDYYQIAAKLIPTEVKAEVYTPEGITINFIEDSGCKPIGTNPDGDTGS